MKFIWEHHCVAQAGCLVVRPLQGIPTGGEGQRVMGSDAEEMCRVLRKVITGVADSLGDPGDGGRFDLLSVTWLIGYEETFLAFT